MMTLFNFNELKDYKNIPISNLETEVSLIRCAAFFKQRHCVNVSADTDDDRRFLRLFLQDYLDFISTKFCTSYVARQEQVIKIKLGIPLINFREAVNDDIQQHVPTKINPDN